MKLPQEPPRFDPRSLHEVLPRLAQLGPEQRGRYLHWDELRRRKAPDGMTVEQWWFGVYLSRQPLQKQLPIRTGAGEPFTFGMTETAQSLAHRIDRDAMGPNRAPAAIANRATRRQYLVRSLIEEALTSSQLEGAVATAKEAKQLIRAGRAPRNTSERMVLNNYHAMELIREHRDAPLDRELLCDLHAIITADTLDDPEDAGRLRTRDDDVKVVDHADATVLHTPPDAAQLDRRVDAMCRFANGDGVGFIHPVVRAVLLHFWLGHDHPFCDGNGRTARALFYWSMLHQGYWLVEYISISRILEQARSKYVRSFLFSETWPYDATHFVIDQLSAIHRSIEDLHRYLARKLREVHELELLVDGHRELNHRQLALLGEAVRDPGAVFTMTSHKQSHQISHETARQDLYKLRQMGLLQQRKRGRTLEFTPVADLRRVLARGGG